MFDTMTCGKMRMLAGIAAWCVAFAGQVRGFVAPLDLGQKCVAADVILRGEVVDVVPLLAGGGGGDGSRGERPADPGYSGPMSVAVVRVKAVLKSTAGGRAPQGLVFVPCDFNFDESPCDLTNGKDYVLFLKDGGHSFYNTAHYACTYRVEKETVGTSGRDIDPDAEADAKPGDRVSYAEFAKQVKEALEKKAMQPVPDEVIAGWGYRTVEVVAGEQDGWEEKEFGKAQVTVQSIKALEEMKGEPRTFARFHVTREVYGTPEDAARRVARIHESAPGVNTKMHPHLALRDGRARGKEVYVISTDAVLFDQVEKPRLVKLLEKWLEAGR